MTKFNLPQGGVIRHYYMTELVRHLATPDHKFRILEVGSFEGQSALVWSNAVATYCPAGGSVTCVDTWRQYHSRALVRSAEAYQQMDLGLQDGSVYETFLHNIQFAYDVCPVQHYRSTLAQCFATLEPFSFDLVYIDGDHVASGVAADLALGQQLVRAGGILCGDDLEVQGDGCDWDLFLSKAEDTDYFQGAHPGVTVVLWKTFGRVWMREGVWAMQNTETGWKAPEIK